MKKLFILVMVAVFAASNIGMHTVKASTETISKEIVESAVTALQHKAGYKFKIVNTPETGTEAQYLIKYTDNVRSQQTFTKAVIDKLQTAAKNEFDSFDSLVNNAQVVSSRPGWLKIIVGAAMMTTMVGTITDSIRLMKLGYDWTFDVFTPTRKPITQLPETDFMPWATKYYADDIARELGYSEHTVINKHPLVVKSGETSWNTLVILDDNLDFAQLPGSNEVYIRNHQGTSYPYSNIWPFYYDYHYIITFDGSSYTLWFNQNYTQAWDSSNWGVRKDHYFGPIAYLDETSTGLRLKKEVYTSRINREFMPEPENKVFTSPVEIEFPDPEYIPNWREQFNPYGSPENPNPSPDPTQAPTSAPTPNNTPINTNNPQPSQTPGKVVIPEIITNPVPFPSNMPTPNYTPIPDTDLEPGVVLPPKLPTVDPDKCGCKIAYSLGKPWTLAQPFLMLISAAASFLISLMTFVFTLPMIPSKPIENPALQFVMEYKAGDIPLVASVQWLITLFISLSIFKVIRRMF